MKILFDQNVPFNLREYLLGHYVQTAEMLGWDQWENGELMRGAEKAGFETFVTCDQSLRYQQNLARRRIAIVEFSLAHWPSIQAGVTEIVEAIEASSVGEYKKVECRYVPGSRRRGS